MKRILFLCTGNSCRSQMAEGFTRALKGDVLEAYSAGVEKHGLNPIAVRVMAEVGVDISGYASKRITELPTLDFDYVVTVCDNAQGRCPVFPGKAKLIHHRFDDPPSLARGLSDEFAVLDIYRRARDEIRTYVLSLPKSLDTKGITPLVFS